MQTYILLEDRMLMPNKTENNVCQNHQSTQPTKPMNDLFDICFLLICNKIALVKKNNFANSTCSVEDRSAVLFRDSIFILEHVDCNLPRVKIPFKSCAVNNSDASIKLCNGIKVQNVIGNVWVNLLKRKSENFGDLHRLTNASAFNH